LFLLEEEDEMKRHNLIPVFATTLVYVLFSIGSAQDCDMRSRWNQEYDPDDCTAALWHLNEGSGDTAYDASGNDNHGVFTNVAWTDSGRFIGAAVFNGSTSQITVSNSPSLNPLSLTVEAWIYPETLDHDHNIADKKELSTSGYRLTVRKVEPYLVFGAHGSVQTHMEANCWDSIPMRQWTHVAGTWDDSTKRIRVYVNGELKGENTYPGNTIATNSHDLVIGRNRTGGGVHGETFDGIIDEVRISDVARDFDPLPHGSLIVEPDTFCLDPGIRKVALTVYNQDSLAAMAIPLRHETPCPSLAVDSVTFWSTRIENWESKTVIINPDTVVLGLVADLGGGTPPLPPGEGSIGYVYFSIPCDTANVYDSCFIAWDTATVQPESQHLLFVDNHENEFIPSFASGTTFVALHRPGDVNGNCAINVGDVVYLISYLYKGGPEPRPTDAGDVNGDCSVDIGDVVYLVNYLYKGGPPPVCGCASHPELAGNCGGCRDSYDMRKTAGPAEVRLINLKSSERGKQVAVIDGSFGVDVAGVQFEFSYKPDEIHSIVPELTDRTKELELFFIATDGIFKIGIVDLSAEHVIAAGEGPLVGLNTEESGLGSLKLQKAILVDEKATPLDVVILPKEEEGSAAPRRFSLSQNHPNPFNPETEIGYGLSQASHVNLVVYDLLGRKVRTLVSEHQSAGSQSVIWDGRDEQGAQVASGVYFYRLKAGEFCAARKMIMLK
jgi:hypothetical protein